MAIMSGWPQSGLPYTRKFLLWPQISWLRTLSDYEFFFFQKETDVLKIFTITLQCHNSPWKHLSFEQMNLLVWSILGQQTFSDAFSTLSGAATRNIGKSSWAMDFLNIMMKVSMLKEGLLKVHFYTILRWTTMAGAAASQDTQLKQSH